MRLRAVVMALLCCACQQREQVAQTKSGGGAAQVHTWYKTPAQIESTALNSWQLSPSLPERHKYFNALAPLYGGIDKLLMTTTLTQPTSGYVLALDAVSAWLSHNLMEEERRDSGFLFNGGWFTTDNLPEGVSCEDCYSNNSEEWCDCDDDIELGQFHKGMSVTSEQRKRLMHNIQDIGDYLNIPIDNKLEVDGYAHAAEYLLEKVLIPNLQAETHPCVQNKNSEPETCPDYDAWHKVVYTIMMSGPFYINLTLVEGGN